MAAGLGSRMGKTNSHHKFTRETHLMAKTRTKAPMSSRIAGDAMGVGSWCLTLTIYSPKKQKREKLQEQRDFEGGPSPTNPPWKTTKINTCVVLWPRRENLPLVPVSACVLQHPKAFPDINCSGKSPCSLCQTYCQGPNVFVTWGTRALVPINHGIPFWPSLGALQNKSCRAF